MKIAIFGATGGTGRELVAQALAARHEVTAVARNPAAVTAQGERLRVVKADVSNAEEVAAALAGQDVAVSVVGPRPGTPPGTLISGAVRHILAGMQRQGVRRFVFESGLMVGEARGMSPLQRVGIAGFRLMNRALYRDKVVAERLVRESPVEWVIVRPPAFGEGPARGHFRLGADLDGKLTKMSNADVAAAMLKAATDPALARQALELSY
ncbi:MAG: NAD(P)-dependent oxidoreductase [Myxococcales bacterium]